MCVNKGNKKIRRCNGCFCPTISRRPQPLRITVHENFVKCRETITSQNLNKGNLRRLKPARLEENIQRVREALLENPKSNLCSNFLFSFLCSFHLQKTCLSKKMFHNVLLLLHESLTEQ